MDPTRRHPRSILLAGLVALALVVSACGASSTPSPSPTSTPTPVPSPSAAPSSPSPEPSPSPTPCAALPGDLAAPAARLVGVYIEDDPILAPTSDLVIFDFAPDEDAPSGSRPGSIEPVEPPFVQDPSGLPLEVSGDRFLRVRFDGLVLYDDHGRPVRQTSEPVTSEPPAVVEVAREAEYEGVSSWVIGLVGDGCVTVWTLEDDLDVIVAIDH